MPLSSTALRKLFPIGLMLAIVSGCQLAQRLTKPSVVTSPGGKFQLTLPSGWREDSSLHEKAQIKASNRLQEMYVIVLSEDKADLAQGMTLDKFTELTRGRMIEKVSSPEATAPLPVTINGKQARQYELQGTIENTRVIYLITTVETPGNLHQIITWTLRSRKDQNQGTLREVTESFREAS